MIIALANYLRLFGRESKLQFELLYVWDVLICKLYAFGQSRKLNLADCKI